MRDMILRLLPEIGVTDVTGVTETKKPSKSASLNDADTVIPATARDVTGVTDSGMVHSLHSTQKEVYQEKSNEINSGTPVTAVTPDFVQDFIDTVKERAAILEFNAPDIYPSREAAAVTAIEDGADTWPERWSNIQQFIMTKRNLSAAAAAHEAGLWLLAELLNQTHEEQPDASNHAAIGRSFRRRIKDAV